MPCPAWEMFRVVSPGGLRLAAATVGLAAAIVLVVFNAAPHVSLEQTALAAGVGAPVHDTGGIPTLSLSTGAENLHPVQKSQAYRLKDSLRRLLGRIRASSNVARRHASRQAKHFAKYLADPRFAAYADEGHHAPYDFHMEKDEWTRIARDFRATHPGMAPKTEQRRLNAIWREVHPYFYHAKGPRRDNVPASDEARGREGQRGGRATVGRPGCAANALSIPLLACQTLNRTPPQLLRHAALRALTVRGSAGGRRFRWYPCRSQTLRASHFPRRARRGGSWRAGQGPCPLRSWRLRTTVSATSTASKPSTPRRIWCPRPTTPRSPLPPAPRPRDPRIVRKRSPLPGAP